MTETATAAVTAQVTSSASSSTAAASLPASGCSFCFPAAPSVVCCDTCRCSHVILPTTVKLWQHRKAYWMWCFRSRLVSARSTYRKMNCSERIAQCFSKPLIMSASISWTEDAVLFQSWECACLLLTSCSQVKFDLTMSMLPLNWCKVIYIVSLYPSSYWLLTMSRSSFTRSSKD